MSVFDPVEVGHLADVLADVEAEVPQRLEQPADRPLAVRSDRPAGDDQQVEVRVQAQRAAAVAADRADRHGGDTSRSAACREVTHQAVHTIGVPRERGPAGPALPGRPRRTRPGRRRGGP